MAIQTEESFLVSGDTLMLRAIVSYDDVTGDITEVEATAGPRDCLVKISSPGRPTIESTIRAGRTVRRGNVQGGYNINTVTTEVGYI